jgi:hypothetical protein
MGIYNTPDNKTPVKISNRRKTKQHNNSNKRIKPFRFDIGATEKLGLKLNIYVGHSVQNKDIIK